jgi:inner membrane protein
MDNICHTLVGGAMARAGFDRRTPLATATMMIGANFPDIDVVAVPFGVQLSVRRGVTHGVLALIVLPFVLAGLMVLWDRHVRRRRDPSLAPAVPRQLLLLSAISMLTHPVLDGMNSYGMRWLMPFLDRWYYFDSLFIIDPWLWAALGAGYWLSRGGRVRPARLALASSAVYIVAMMALTVVARSAVIRRESPGLGLAAPQLMVAPVPANPFARQIVLEQQGEYRVGRYAFLDGGLRMTGTIPINRGHPAVAQARRDPDVQRFLRWARFPFFVVTPSGTESTVHVVDARYSTGIAGSWASITVGVPAGQR